MIFQLFSACHKYVSLSQKPDIIIDWFVKHHNHRRKFEEGNLPPISPQKIVDPVVLPAPLHKFPEELTQNET